MPSWAASSYSASSFSDVSISWCLMDLQRSWPHPIFRLLLPASLLNWDPSCFFFLPLFFCISWSSAFPSGSPHSWPLEFCLILSDLGFHSFRNIWLMYWNRPTISWTCNSSWDRDRPFSCWRGHGWIPLPLCYTNASHECWGRPWCNCSPTYRWHPEKTGCRRGWLRSFTEMSGRTLLTRLITTHHVTSQEFVRKQWIQAHIFSPMFPQTTPIWCVKSGRDMAWNSMGIQTFNVEILQALTAGTSTIST